MTGRKAYLISTLSGLVAAVGQAPLSFPWATVVGLGVIFWLFRDAKNRRAAAWFGWFFGLGYFAASLFWIIEPFLVDFTRHGWMAPFALMGLSGGQALIWALAFWGAKFLTASGWRLALGWAVALSAAELARSYLLTGFPWALIGHVWIGWAPMQLAAWIGPHGLTLVTLLMVSLGLTAWQFRRVMVLVGLLPIVVAYGLCSLRSMAKVPTSSNEAAVVRLVQPNAPQHLKWHPDHAPGFFARQVEYTAAPADDRPDLIIWPETSVPATLHHAGPALERIAAAAAGVPVVLGIQRVEQFRAYNSMLILNDEGHVADIYDKHHLVPFGEYVPVGNLMARFGITAFAAQQGFGYSSGPGARLVDLGPLGKVLPLICYEAIFPQDVNSTPERPGWLLQITNDAWFGKIAGPYQHLAQARLRAVEQGLPMVRVANTGVSAVIDARGNVTASLGLGQAGYLDAPLSEALPITFYARFGDWPSVSIIIVLMFAGFATQRRNKIDGPTAGA